MTDVLDPLRQTLLVVGGAFLASVAIVALLILVA